MKIFLIFSILFFSIKSYTHSGRTNSAGCHNNRKTGGYHCHGYSYKEKITSFVPQKNKPEKKIIDIDSLHKEAKNGQADSQFLLGVIYYIGKGVPKDLKKSAELFNKSRKNGNLLAEKIFGNKGFHKTKSKNPPKLRRLTFKNPSINTLYVSDSYLEIEKEIESDEKWLIDGEIYEAKTYCFGLYEGDRIKFIEGTPGICVSAKFIKKNSNRVCEVWCE